MSTADSHVDRAALEECVDLLSDFVAAHEHYPLAVLAMAMRTHLVCLLQGLLEHGVLSREQTSAFIGELCREVFPESPMVPSD